MECNQIAEFNFVSDLGKMDSLQVLLLSHNSIHKLDGNLRCAHLIRLELKHNNLKRFFVDQFLMMSKEKLAIDLSQNKLESVDFRNLNVSKDDVQISKLFIELGDQMTCNCHTISLYNFLMHRLEIAPTIYESIEVSPPDLKCIRTDTDTPETVKKIDKNSLTCPLNLPHQILCPTPCRCVRRPYDMLLIIACQNIAVVPFMPPYRTLTDIKLNKVQLKINGNGIERLPSKRRDLNYNDVTEIYASHNHIRWIIVDNIPDHLEYLDLKLNRMKHLPVDVVVQLATLKFLHLKDNPWNCSESFELIRFVKTHRDIVKDFNMIQCSNQQFFLEFNVDEKCSGRVVLAIVVIIIMLLGVGSFYVYQRKRIQISEWIFLNDKLHLLERFFDKMKLFDAIIVATEYDKIFGKYITAKLIDKPNRFKIGLLIKNWAAEDPMPKSVLKNLRNARRVIVVLSEYFEECDWKRWDHFHLNSRIIFVVKNKANTSSIDITNKMSIKFGDPWFWDKMKHAMAHREELIVDTPSETHEVDQFIVQQ